MDMFMFSESSTTANIDDAWTDTLFKNYSLLETSDSEFSDFTSTASSRPAKIPPLILQACYTLIQVLLSHPGRTVPLGHCFRLP
jgi:hypothetical protein